MRLFLVLLIGITLASRAVANDNVQTVKKLSEDAETAYASGKFTLAFKLAGDALDFQLVNSLEDNLFIARCYHIRSRVRELRGMKNEAKSDLIASIKIAERLGKNGLADLAQGLEYLAFIYLLEENYVDAESKAKNALDIAERAWGKDNVKLVSIFCILTPAFLKQNKLEEAEMAAKRAIRITEATGKPNHQALPELLNNLASIYAVKNNFAESETIGRRALAIAEKVWAYDTPETFLIVCTITRCCIEQGNYKEADKFTKRILNFADNNSNPAFPFLPEALGVLAQSHLKKGRNAEAKTMAERALESAKFTWAKETFHYKLIFDIYETTTKFKPSSGRTGG